MFLVLTACAPVAAMPTETPTLTAPPDNAPTRVIIQPPTQEPTATFTPEASPTTEPLTPEQQLTEYLKTEDAQKSIDQFVNAYQLDAETAELVRNNFALEERSSKDGKQYVVALASVPQDNIPLEGQKYADLYQNIPLMIAEKEESGEWIWSKATLRKMADKVGMPIGSLLDLEQPKSLDIAKKEFSVFSMINIGWMWREKQQGTINFSWSDKQNQFAKENNMVPIAQHLVFTEDLPDWVKKGNFTNEQLTDLLKKHIHDTMSHYPDVEIWSVVNEAWFINNVNLDFWYSKLGKDYIKIAFETARQENPSAILCYSDFLNEVPGKRATWNHEIVETLKEDNLIDGLMMHMRINAANPPKKDGLISMMQSYGVPIYITELTVDLINVSGTQEKRFLKQAEIYKTIMEAAIESGVTKSFVMWGIGDSANYLEIMVGKPNADPTIYDDNLERKPAYYALLQAMFEALPQN